MAEREARDGSEAPGRVRGLTGPEEIDRWCACPRASGDPRLASWIEEERAWVGEHHPGTENLFVFDDGERFLGKYDVPFDEAGRWELWAPSVEPHPAAGAIMRALCRHLVAEARRRGVASVELVLEEGDPRNALALPVLRELGFVVAETRVVVTRALDEGCPSVAAPALDIRDLSDLGPEARDRLRRAVGAALPSGRVRPTAWGQAAFDRTMEPIGLVEAQATAPSTILLLEHIGVVPRARGCGVGRALLLSAWQTARARGLDTYVGSTAEDNRAMLRVFDALGCRRMGRRRILRLAPVR